MELGRKVLEAGESFQLKEVQYPYIANFGAKKSEIGVQNTYDTLGWYPGDQFKYPGRNWLDKILIWILHFPHIGDYVAFLSNGKTRKTLKRFEQHYNRKKPELAVRAIKRSIPLDCILNKTGAWSDDWSYWKVGYPGFIVTDLAYIRSPRYHRDDDIAEHINFSQFTEVVWKLRETIEAFVNKEF